jgi:deferrochelatase/peroxidase EfeB
MQVARQDIRQLTDVEPIPGWGLAASTTSASQATPRNLLGFKDGTRNFTDGIDPRAGTLLGGLFFIAFMKDPSQFIRLQRSLAADALNEYIHHTGSAVFACPPGLRPGQHWGDSLFT